MSLVLKHPPPLALYIHIPWCVRKCPYCDFNSHVTEQIPEAAYIDALLADVQLELPLVWGRRIHSVFIGGGTPSLFSPHAIEHLLTQLRALLPISPHAEITLEANPGSVEAARFADFRAAGINRLSIGVQSFNDKHLHALGRIHDANAAIRAIETALRADFASVNIDLMYALPEQTLAEALADVHTAIALQPGQISYYQLTLEPNTAFFHTPPPLPDDDNAWDIQLAGRAALAAAGYIGYETSAFARAGHQCRHNINYWEFGDYLGIGAGAHGKLTFVNDARIERRWKMRSPRDYMQHAGTPASLAGQHDLTPAELPFEFMMNALRLTEGVPIDYFATRTGVAYSSLEQRIQTLVDEDWVALDHASRRFAPTQKGRDFLNDLLIKFLPDNA
ncbi:MAG: radical SAM family heme chaperone HemW [Gammaproteobacteria bacterium]|nr:radical SAM family heme chaperone HemW [Gammaproteobacteria bacterium]